MDALLIIFADSDSVLIPWDVNLAGQFASVSEIVPFTDFNRNFLLAVRKSAENKLDSEQGRKLLEELSGFRGNNDKTGSGKSIINGNSSETFIDIHDSAAAGSQEKDQHYSENSAETAAECELKTSTAVLHDRVHVYRKPVLELSSSTSYPVVCKAQADLCRFIVRCEEEGADSFLESKRIIKTEEEIECLKKAASITDRVFLKLEKFFKESFSEDSERGECESPETAHDASGNTGREETCLTETDIALFIETEGRKEGAEGTGFETLAASPERSFSIHPFPSYSDKKAPAPGLTIIDFGHKYEGYTSDVTTTVAYGKLTEKQEKMISLVKEATEIFESILGPGISTVKLTEAVTSLFEKNGFTMPHALGHGIGLDVHESPVLKNLKRTETILKPGMVLAVEPGIYSPESGGVRLENDYMITETGFEKITNSRIIRL